MPRLSPTRIYPRYPLRRVVSYHHAGKRFLTLTLDLGVDGMKIETHCHLPDDEELSFKLVLGDNHIASKGRVVRSELLPRRRTVSDIEFTELTERNLAILQKYLTTIKERPRPRGMLTAGERKDAWSDIIKTREKY